MKSFYEAKEIVGQDGPNENYLVIAENKNKDYTLIFRNAQYQPWVVAWGYNKAERYWCQGHYFNDLADAAAFMYG